MLKSGALLAIPAILLAQPGSRLLTFTSSTDHSEQPYALYLPSDFDSSKTYPLVVSLHSEESTHRLNFRQLLGLASAYRQVYPEDPHFFPVAHDVEYIAAFPFARGTIGYQGIAETDVYDMLADIERRFPIDRDRVYLTGISMGGGGALWYALTRPDVWAAVAPLAAATIPGSEELAPNALNLPIRLFHGDQDPIVPVQSSRDWQRRLIDVGVDAQYFEFPAVRHNIWDFAYQQGAIFDWFAHLRRNRSPERVHFVSQCYRYNSAYWIQIDGLTPGTLASIDAKRTDGGVEVQTRNVAGFTLTLDGPAALVTIDGSPLRVKPAATLSFSKASGQWKPGRFAPAGKRMGSEGPIAAAFAGHQIYVYGSLNTQTADELAARRRNAEQAAHWQSGGPPEPGIGHAPGLSFPVKADSEVTPEDLANADLILFGTRETNSLVARFAGALPLELNAGAADYGLLFIAPAGQHYVVVSSGLPWWTGAAEAARGGDRLAPDQYRLVSTFGDYILFKGSLAHVISEGRFDRNWKVTPDAAAKMQATGTVTIH
jgi:pimeloyl-ACP methyl ester carboxylesterase